MKPRCPFRMKAFDQPDECDPNCAWLMRTPETEQYGVCAVAALARTLSIEPTRRGEWVPANYWNEVER